MKHERSSIAAEPGLKICIFCDALNHASNVECCNCTWSGAFDFDPGHVNDVLSEIDFEVEVLHRNEPEVALTWFQSLKSRIHDYFSSFGRVLSH
jgi:hypothetical protein